MSKWHPVTATRYGDVVKLQRGAGTTRWHPKPEDLTPYMHQVMESAYEGRERVRCSRDDFYDGYLAALRMLRSKSSFRPEAWRDDAAE